MNNFTIQVRNFIIIDCLSDNELQTAKKLYEDIDDFIGIEGYFTVERKVCKTKEALVSCLSSILQRCKDDNIQPLLHFEGHGDHEIFAFPKGSSISWGEIYSYLRAINEETRNNLIVHFATCKSESVYDNVDISKPCPAFAILVAVGNIKTKFIQDGFFALYKEFIKNNNYSTALEKFRDIVGCGRYAYIVAPELFKTGFSNFVKMHDNSLYPEYFEHLVDKASIEYSIDASTLRKFIKEGMKKPIYQLLENQKNIFLMLDRFTELKSERDLNLKEIEYSLRGW